MTLNYEHQLMIVTDILKQHESECCGRVAECEQLERLILSLLNNQDIPLEKKQMLTDIYNYSTSVRNSAHIDLEITNFQPQLSHWVTSL